MTREEQLIVTQNRLNKLEGSPKNIKCPGVVRKLKRAVRNLSK